MSTMNPLKFVGGLVLEIGAVIAVLAILPGFGSSERPITSHSSGSPASLAPPAPNRVFFDAASSRVLDHPHQERPAPRAAWQNEFAPLPSPEQRRFVEEMLDHNSQRALDTAARMVSEGDRLLPPELRVRRDPAPQPIPEATAHAQPLTPPLQSDFQRPSHYAPSANHGIPIRPEQRFDDRY